LGPLKPQQPVEGFLAVSLLRLVLSPAWQALIAIKAFAGEDKKMLIAVQASSYREEAFFVRLLRRLEDRYELRSGIEMQGMRESRPRFAGPCL
jgi:hypothetical protein